MDDRGGGAGALNAREWLDSTITGPRARNSLSNGEYPKASAQHKAPSAKISEAPRRASPIWAVSYTHLTLPTILLV